MPGEPAIDHVTVNGRTYAVPQSPVVVVCLDGCDPEYLAAGFAANELPVFARIARDGFASESLSALPSFTNPNNCSLVTGVPPSVHGVSGNFYLDRHSGETVMVTGDKELQAPTILAAMAQTGVPTAVVTAKDKLRAALAKGLPIGANGIAFSAQNAAAAREQTHGIGNVTRLVGRGEPDQYSADLSLFVLDAGVRLLETGRARLLYLSLSDYVQHRYAPQEPEARDFLRAVDARLGRMMDLGAIVAATADHGMHDMAKPDGTPNVMFVGDVLDAAFGPGSCRVICPITDPFVRHHGALGGLVRVYVAAGGPAIRAVTAHLADLPGIDQALEGSEACRRYDL
ncbi:MAG TPA: phosphonoacetate hydrolase, partial [Acetobacteraceae bacterium]|nr:phosphonoacetate hydrolase [Acetobacteraceae bacterium]